MDRSILDTIPRFAKSQLSVMLERPDTWWLMYGMEEMRSRALTQLESMGFVKRIHDEWDTHELTEPGREVAAMIERDDYTIEVRDGEWFRLSPDDVAHIRSLATPTAPASESEGTADHVSRTGKLEGEG